MKLVFFSMMSSGTNWSMTLPSSRRSDTTIGTEHVQREIIDVVLDEVVIYFNSQALKLNRWERELVNVSSSSWASWKIIFLKREDLFETPNCYR